MQILSISNRSYIEGMKHVDKTYLVGRELRIRELKDEIKRLKE